MKNPLKMTSNEEEKQNIRLHNIVPSETISENKAFSIEHQSSKDTKHTDDNDPDTLCGYGSWTPQWLQKAAEPKLFLFFFSMAGVAESAAFSYFVGCLSTIEKRFAFDTTMSSYIMITLEISSVVFGVVVGYFGKLVHRPRLLTFGMLTGTIGCFLFAVPYFVYGPHRIHEKLERSAIGISGVNAELCDRDINEITEPCSKSSTVPVVTFFFVGNFLRSIAVVIYYSIGPPYIDDNVKKKNSPVYFGLIFALHLFSPVIGFLLSSLCLSFNEDLFHDPGFDAQDRRWVGAWWLGFIIMGIFNFLFSVPMILFPKRFPKKKIPLSLQNKKPDVMPLTLIEQLKDMGKALKRLVKNPILICQYLGSVFRLNGIEGYYILLPKYMEMQFRQTASDASLISGPASIIGMQVGVLLGGLAIHKFRPRPRVLTGGIVIAESFIIISFICCMFISCSVDHVGSTNAAVSPLFNHENECNLGCKCTTKEYTPVCGPDGKSTYFSPCFAGCKGHNKTGEIEVFTDCKCVHNQDREFIIGDANKNYCGFECQWLITFIIVLSLGKLLSSTARVGNAIVILRCVDPEDKSIALGASSGIFSLLAFIPCPLIYAALTDSSCLIWEESCGKTGNCWVYDTDKLRYLLHGVSAAFVFLGCVTDIIVWRLSPRLQNLYDDDEDDKGNTAHDIAESKLFNNDETL